MQTATTTSQAYEVVLKTILSGSRIAPRGIETREILDYQFRVSEPSFAPIVTYDTKRNAVIADYLAREIHLFLKGELRASAWVEYASKFWGKIANPDGTINSNYHHLVRLQKSTADNMTQWEWCEYMLKSDPDTRQAVFHVNQPVHQWMGVQDFPCTMYGMFTIRHDKLNLSISMRSNDVVLGLVYDMPWWCFVLNDMATELDIPVGRYTHKVDSMHMYEHDLLAIERMLGHE